MHAYACPNSNREQNYRWLIKPVDTLHRLSALPRQTNVHLPASPQLADCLCLRLFPTLNKPAGDTDRTTHAAATSLHCAHSNSGKAAPDRDAIVHNRWQPQSIKITVNSSAGFSGQQTVFGMNSFLAGGDWRHEATHMRRDVKCCIEKPTDHLAADRASANPDTTG